MKGLVTAAVVTLLLLTPLALLAQPQQEDLTLPELARREKARRAAIQEPVRTITDLELRSRVRFLPRPEDETAVTAGPEESAPQPAAEEEKDPDQVREETRAGLQAKVDELGERIQRVQAAMDEAQRELNDLTNLTYGPRRASLLKLVEDGQADIASSQAAIDDIEEQARRERVRITRP